MKKSIFMLGAVVTLTFVSCTKEKTTVTEADGDQATVVTPGVNENALDSAGAKIENAAEVTGDAIKEGAEDVKEGAEKVGAEVKDAAKDATDGDGDISK